MREGIAVERDNAEQHEEAGGMADKQDPEGCADGAAGALHGHAAGEIADAPGGRGEQGKERVVGK